MVLSRRILEMLEQSEIDMLLSRLTMMQDWKDNVSGVEIKNFGRATAFSVKEIPGPLFNTVKGMHEEDKEFIDEIIPFYEEKEIPIVLEITPFFVTLEFIMTLSQKEFFHSGFRTVLYAPLTGNRAEQSQEASPNVSIQPLQKDEFDTFGQLYVEGFQMPDSSKKDVARRHEILFDREGWHFYIARIGNEPAGTGVLFVKDEVASLIAATTIPKFQNRGIQKLLIQKRISEAKRMNCKYIVCQTSVGSTSQLNMEKMGMKIAYTKAIWTRRTISN